MKRSRVLLYFVLILIIVCILIVFKRPQWILGNNFQKCIAKTSDDTVKITYTGIGRSRSEFTFGKGYIIKSVHSISDGRYHYTWFNDDKTGEKVLTSTVKTLSAQANQLYKKNIDEYNEKNKDKKIDFSCTFWIPNQSFFVIPKDKIFIDMSADIQGVVNNNDKKLKENR